MSNVAETRSLLSWNLTENNTGGLNNPETQAAIFALEPDFAVFPEAIPENGMRSETLRAFSNAGYEAGSGLWYHNCDDTDGRKDRHGLVMIAKPELVAKGRPLQLYGRTALQLWTPEGRTVTGLHLDDRAEATRVRQVRSLLYRHDGQEPAASAIVMGDLNSTYHHAPRAAALRAINPLLQRMPKVTPGETAPNLPRFRRAMSLGSRFADMHTGDAMRVFDRELFTDADPTHSPTIKKGPLKAQVDRILRRGDFVVVSPTVVASSEGLSDHQRIQATVQVIR